MSDYVKIKKKQIEEIINMYCKICGSRLDSNVKFCPKCGFSITIDNSIITTDIDYPKTPQQPSTLENKLSTQKIKNKKSVIIAIATVAVTILLLIILSVVFKSKSDNFSSKENTTNIVTDEKFDTSTSIIVNEKDSSLSGNEKVNNNISNLSYEDVALAYVKEMINGDIVAAQNYCLLNCDEQNDVAEKFLTNHGSNLNEYYEKMEEDLYNDDNTQADIKNLKDCLHYCATDLNYLTASNFSIAYAKKMDLSLLKEKSFMLECLWGINLIEYLYRYNDNVISSEELLHYFNFSKISEIYEVKVELTITRVDGYTDSTYIYINVANYQGEWKVCKNPITILE